MAPVTRSSAPSTPAKSHLNGASDVLVTPPSANTRRTPHCTKCHRPRTGHPRSGCPFVNASDSSPTTGSSLLAHKPVPLSVDDRILEDLSSLHIVSPSDLKNEHASSTPRSGKRSRRKLSVRFAVVPQQTLASLSPTDSQLVEQLLQPGMISDVVSPQDKVAHVLKWRKTLCDAGKEEPIVVKAELQADSAARPLSRCMPCTFSTPTASLTVTEPITDQGIGGSVLDMNETVYLLPDHDIPKITPLSRSMSFEQRSSFLQQLSHSSGTAPATLVSLPLADLDSVRADAERIGFIVRVLPGPEDNQKWVVLGTEEEAVDILAEKFLEEERTSTRVEGKGTKLTAVAGGVIFGAVATWTGLAFS